MKTRLFFPTRFAASFWFFALSALVPAAPALAQADNLEARGLDLVLTYCADCHAVGPHGQSLHELAPPFRQLHERFDVKFLEEALVEGLVAHPDMPEFEFDVPQAQAIIAYLEFLQPD